MFWLAIFGNLTYGLAILVRELDSVYVIRHVPWLVGSLGVILLDASVSFETLLLYMYITWKKTLLVKYDFLHLLVVEQILEKKYMLSDITNMIIEGKRKKRMIMQLPEEYK